MYLLVAILGHMTCDLSQLIAAQSAHFRLFTCHSSVASVYTEEYSHLYIALDYLIEHNLTMARFGRCL